MEDAGKSQKPFLDRAAIKKWWARQGLNL